ncbi:GGDEF domain-containing protein [Paraburkholderia sp. ZP32-5]|uniref:GGDEF domain-containing protein n=1 Tax=Paraburkholderia sp. ZP32-5 TaxID=2883245 RepID=UPI001F47F01D|nr:GGDEF domain-containing protein [Paraburkholderia sp. ZP32-5]
MAETDLFEFESKILASARVVFDDTEAGATGYRDALGQLIGHYERLMRETRRLIRRSDREELEMNRLNQRLQELAQELGFRVRHDSLTRALNRGAVIEQATAILTRDSLAVVILDIDNFKRINDTFGHPVGDMVICELVDCLRQALGETAIFGRLGGEEFAVLLPGIDLAEGVKVAERVRLHIAQKAFGSLSAGQVTASFGVSWNACGASYDEAYRLADEALYVAKRTGRDRVVGAR